MSDPGTDPDTPANSDDDAALTPPGNSDSGPSADSSDPGPDQEPQAESASAPPPLSSDAETASSGDEPAADSDAPSPESLTKDERNWAAALHGAGGLGLVFYFSAIPFLNILAPLVIWLIKRDESPFINSQGKEVLNFHLSWTLYALVVGLVIGGIGLVLTLIIIGVFILWGLAILGGLYAIIMAVMAIIGTISAADGKPYRYPATIRFIK